jgi:hypothetical protein
MERVKMAFPDVRDAEKTSYTEGSSFLELGLAGFKKIKKDFRCNDLQ